MKETPILFKDEMVRAYKAGLKTQTRRVVTKKRSIPGDQRYYGSEFPLDRFISPEDCPYGGPGDRLWFRETWAPVDHLVKGYETDDPEWVMFRADGALWNTTTKCEADRGDLINPERWKPSIFMPRWACRFTPEITETRLERVQDIRAKDVFAEGWPDAPTSEYIETPEVSHIKEGFDWFHELWNSINAKRGMEWETNLWVWVIEFQHRRAV